MIVPELLDDGTVRVDMGEPIVDGAAIGHKLKTNSDGRIVAAPLEVGGKRWTVTSVSMGNPHAVVFECDGEPLKVRAYVCMLCCAHAPAQSMDTRRLGACGSMLSCDGTMASVTICMLAS
jgi:diaminopimelate epimerase